MKDSEEARGELDGKIIIKSGSQKNGRASITAGQKSWREFMQGASNLIIMLQITQHPLDRSLSFH